LLLGIFLLGMGAGLPVMDGQVEAQDDNIGAAGGDVIALVDDEEILLQDIDEFLRVDELVMNLFQMNQEFTQVLLQSEAGQELMNEYRKMKFEEYLSYYLLQREVERQEIELTEEKRQEFFDEHLELILTENNLTEEQFVMLLQQQGLQSVEDYRDLFMEVNQEEMLIFALQEELFVDLAVSEEEMQNYYQDNQEIFAEEAGVEVSHILVEERELAEELLERLEAGEDFAGLAREYSIDPGAENGRLGLVTEATQFVEPFKSTALGMEAGEISEIVETQFGFHIIKAHEVQEARTLEFEDVRSDIELVLLHEKRSEFWEDYLRELEEDAEVEMKI